MGGAYSMHGREEEFMQGFCGKTGGNRPLGRHGCLWEDNIEMDLRETGWDMNSIHLAQDRASL
jgi:hypothetical protein